jgi:hypothetical protein
MLSITFFIVMLSVLLLRAIKVRIFKTACGPAPIFLRDMLLIPYVNKK